MDSLVSASDGVYALSRDRSGVYRLTGQDSWVKVSDGAQRLYGGRAGLFAVLPGQGDIARYAEGKWTTIGSPGAEFAVTNDALYGLSLDRTSVHQWTPKTGWGTIGGSFEHLYGGGAGVFAVSSGGTINRYADGKWQPIGGTGAELAVTDTALYRLSVNRSSIDEWTPAKGWQPVRGNTQHIYGGGRSLLATDPGRGDVFEYSDLEGKWTVVGGPGATFLSSSMGIVYGVWPDRSTVARRGAHGTWLSTASLPTGSILPAAQKVQRLHELTVLGKETTGTWLRLKFSHEKGEPDPYVFRWEGNGCNVIGDDLAKYGIHFRSACDRHDFGYQNYRDTLGEEGFRKGVIGVTGVGIDSPKNRVDEVFKQDLEQACAKGPAKTDRYGGPPKPPLYDLACRQAAHKVWAAVVIGG
ncbi:phospholipase A2 [Streptomyces xanthophaeus]